MKGKALRCFADRFIHAGKSFCKCSEPVSLLWWVRVGFWNGVLVEDLF